MCKEAGNPGSLITDVDDELLFRIKRAGDMLVAKASSLIENCTSNLCFMSVRAKMMEEKCSIESSPAHLSTAVQRQAYESSWAQNGEQHHGVRSLGSRQGIDRCYRSGGTAS